MGADDYLAAVGWFALLLGGGCCLLGTGHRLLLAVFLAHHCQLGSCCILGIWSSLWLGLRDVAAGNMEAVLVVIDAGDVGM